MARRAGNPGGVGRWAKGSFYQQIDPGAHRAVDQRLRPLGSHPFVDAGRCFSVFSRASRKLAHKFLHSKAEDQAEHEQLTKAVADPATDLVAFEKDKIKGAVRTDFILSAEIIAITLGTVAAAPLMQQVVVLSGIAIVMTIGVYGLVAGIVKLDDLGLWLSQKPGQMARSVGGVILRAAPYMMKSLSVIGTAAMFMVGGGILTHGVPVVHHWIETVSQSTGAVAWLMPTLLNAVAGIIAGAIVLALVSTASKLWRVVKA
ncbi:DUF808 family protein [Pseudomonas rhodesiae]|uniref:DUF808 family protein n=1 Tax=Pseudomonas rhodesiae TaxID=76760 RepID=UPI002852F1A6|nr:DUF808 family protein [Pseudomonas rhodesiae]